MNFLKFFIFFAIFTISYNHKIGKLKKYRDHECIRDCSNTTSLICEYDWTLETYSTLSRACYNCPKNYTDCLREDCILADGILKTVETVNRELPGPYIQVCRGDTIVVNVQNKLRSERVTSIHWHGLKQRNTPFMDGVGMVTQWPILPHTKFQYKFKADDPGTHFWHAHSGIQRSDGIFGALIIRDKDDLNINLYDFDLKEHYMILIEWNSNPLQSIYGSYLHSALFGTEHAILINGKGGFREEPNLNVPLETYHVKKGFRYRFRIINSAIQNCIMYLSIDEHNMTLIATDGQPIEPLEIESLEILSGERYDFVLNTNKKPSDYWIKVQGKGSCEYNKLFQRAILRYDRYEKNGLVLDSTNTISYKESARNGTSFRSIINSQKCQSNIFTINNLKFPQNISNDYFDRISQKPDRVLYLNYDIKPMDDPEFHNPDLYSFKNSLNHWKTSLIDDINFDMPSEPPLLNWNKMSKSNLCNQTHRICSNDSKFCICTHFFEFGLNELIEFVLIDGNAFFEYHPIHLHGHNFAVLGVGKLKTNGILSSEIVKRVDKLGKLKRNFDRPVIKDTIAMPKAGYAVIRFLANNPGFWLFHCHVDTHSDTGMTILIKVGEYKDMPQQEN